MLDQTAIGALHARQGSLTYDRAHGLLYAVNAGSANLSGYRERHSTLTALGNTGTDPGTVDASVSSDRHYLYVQTGAKGVVDAFRINDNGSLTALGSVTVPGGAGGEGIAAT